MADTSLVDVPLKTIDQSTILTVILIILIAYFITREIGILLTWIAERAGVRRITVKMLLPLLKFSIYGVATYFILASILQLTSTQLVAFSGVLGAVLGFGLKDLFADIIGGLVISVEKPYQIGDKVHFGGYYGEVTDIGIRATRLVTPDDNLVSVPNYLIFTQAVASASSGTPKMMVVIDLFIDPDSDAATSMAILKEAAVTSRYVYVSRKHPYTVLLKDFPYYRRLRARAYVLDLRYEFEFESEVTRRAWCAFEKRDIQPPRAPIMGEQQTGKPDAGSGTA
ncbi:MAG TPA: mechanosensitive ion channel [Methanomicrobia archaeon]|nr:mechanosensitive ion channel [Methanomicrobia archaeon]